MTKNYVDQGQVKSFFCYLFSFLSQISWKSILFKRKSVMMVLGIKWSVSKLRPFVHTWSIDQMNLPSWVAEVARVVVGIKWSISKQRYFLHTTGSAYQISTFDIKLVYFMKNLPSWVAEAPTMVVGIKWSVLKLRRFVHTPNFTYFSSWYFWCISEWNNLPYLTAC